jgi:hypothetical protein
LGQNEDLEEKKLLGSGGYVLAKLTEQEELRASLGVAQIYEHLTHDNENELVKITTSETQGDLSPNPYGKSYCKCVRNYRRCSYVICFIIQSLNFVIANSSDCLIKAGSFIFH